MDNERRQFGRIALPLDIEYQPRDLLKRRGVAKMVDLSAGGMRLECPERVQVDSQLELQLRLPTRGKPYVFVGRVVWEQPLAEGSRCGVQFIDVSIDIQADIDQLVQLMGPRR